MEKANQISRTEVEASGVRTKLERSSGPGNRRNIWTSGEGDVRGEVEVIGKEVVDGMEVVGLDVGAWVEVVGQN